MAFLRYVPPPARNMEFSLKEALCSVVCLAGALGTWRLAILNQHKSVPLYAAFGILSAVLVTIGATLFAVNGLSLVEQVRRKRRRSKAATRHDNVVGDAILSVAVLIDDDIAFKTRAKEVAAQIGPTTIQELRHRFHGQGKAPPGFTVLERGLSAWISCWQCAIFEILFNFRAEALPMLRKVAFGEYDWTQGNAIEVLCRLAAEGVDRDRTIADLQREMPNMRDTALVYAARPLLHQVKANPNLSAILEELQEVPEFRDAVEGLQADD